MPKKAPAVKLADENSLIQPKDIPTKSHWWDSFGKMETEISARLLVKYIHKHLKTWGVIDRKALNKATRQDFDFNGLDERGYLVEVGEDQYRVTEGFVAKCYAATHQ